MNIYDLLEQLRRLADADSQLRAALLDTKNHPNPVTEFCRIAGAHGCEISAIDLVMAGEESYAAMRRSTNGGGENSPLLRGEDDLYSMFLIELERD